MASEIRVNSLTNRSGLSTVSITDTGVVIAGMVTATTGNFTQDGIFGGNLTVTGNVSVAGTVTYEDVTNVDSVGLGTFQNGLIVNAGTANTALVVNGDARVTGILTIGTSSITLDGSNNQITANTFVGNVNTTGVSTFSSFDYAAIDKSISDTAVDVFIYNTRNDSDGGAWRKRTQHTSWYNETLNTSIRGSRREFPAVAVIVTETDRVTIYDGDDPDLPMWMVFLSGPDGANERLLRYAANAASEMLNAILCVATADTLAYISFIDEYHRLYHSGAEYYFPERTGIVDRNVIITEPQYDGGYGLPSSDTNDVAMTVLPNAPIDSATGLPKPTIAVATENGVGVIKDNGTVVDIRGNHGGNYNQTLFVDFDSKTNAIISGFDYGAGNTNQIYKLAVFPIPSADVTDDNTLYGYQHHYRRIQTQGNTTIPKLAGNYITDAISAGGDGRYAIQTTASGSYPTALNIIQEEPGTDGSSTTYPSNSRVAYATTSYNTGWMHGDIKGAFLSDTDTTNLSGYLYDDDMQNDDTSDWIDTFADTFAYVTSPVTAYQLTRSLGDARTQRNLFGTISAGTKIIVTYEAQASSGTPSIKYGMTNGSYDQSVLTSVSIDTNWNLISFEATFGTTGSANHTYVTLWNATAGATVYYRNFKVRVIEEDRSVNNNSLAYFGTITKSPVATGAELVAYSGFSASNYLEQPYNSDLNYGTGDFYFGGWFKGAGYSDSLIGRLHDSSSAGKGFLLSIASSGASGVLVFAIYTLGFQSSGRTTVGTTTDETGKGWQQVWGIRRGGTMELWLNGNLISTGSNSADISDTTYNPPLFIGVQHGSSVFDGELALMRTGASAPSPEQIKKMYEDEKVLFQENAKCTLYGSSDTVTALAYDKATDLLHVGTSSGRSDFQGLRRINNTTTAVTTAITAYDEFIIEQ